MPLLFEQTSNGSWRANGFAQMYRIVRVRETMGAKFRIFTSISGQRESGTQVVHGIHDTFEQAVAWCEAADVQQPSTNAALERRRPQ
jgi:hypothetical protein